MHLRVVVAVALACAACASAPAPGRERGAAQCPESQTVCLNARRCDYDAKRDCVVCACRSWDETTPPSAGPAARATPEGAPSVKPPPPPGR